MKSFNRIATDVPRCKGVIFELVLGDEHPGEVDICIRLTPQATSTALRDLGAFHLLEDCARLLKFSPFRTWIEVDTRDDDNFSGGVFGTYRPPLPLTILESLARALGCPELFLPSNLGLTARHVGVLVRKEGREIRIVLSGEDEAAFLEFRGQPLPEAYRSLDLGPIQLALAYNPEPMDTLGIEIVTWFTDAARVGALPMLDTQRALLLSWQSLSERLEESRRIGISHIKYVPRRDIMKAYIAII